MKKDKKEKVKKEKVVKTDDTSAKLDAVLNGINVLAGAVGKLVELQSVKNEEVKEAVVEKKPVTAFNAKLDDETYPSDYVPPKFRKIVDDILSPEFGLKITDFDDRTDFQVHIIVPEKYSSVSKEDKTKGVQDIRSRMVPRALGENGIKDWCTLIRRNLNKFYQKEGVQSPFNQPLE